MTRGRRFLKDPTQRGRTFRRLQTGRGRVAKWETHEGLRAAGPGIWRFPSLAGRTAGAGVHSVVVQLLVIAPTPSLQEKARRVGPVATLHKESPAAPLQPRALGV